MKASLHFPPQGLEQIKALGLRQRSPEKLHWTTTHPASHYGLGVLLRGKSDAILDGMNFRALRDGFGAWIETNDPEKVLKALGIYGQKSNEPGIKKIP